MAVFEDDNILIQKFRVAETRNFAFRQIVSKYQQKVYGLARRMVIYHSDADDVTQETFIKVWRHLHNFREDAALFTWIYRIATNECLNFLQKKKRRFFIPMVDYNAMLSERVAEDPMISGEEIYRKLQQAVLTLPDKQRLVFNMKYFEDMKYEEISEALGTSVGALKASYHHAVKKIEAFLQIP